MLEDKVKKAMQPFGIDIMVILAIIEAVMAMFENCPERRNLAQMMKSPGAIGRVRLRRELRKIISEDDCCRSLRSQVNAVAEALEGAADAMSVEECQSCVNEVFGTEAVAA